ncbi:MAG: bifunctional (p)ppGpp synthetase/guanosine-3',5'-bis(diphosphate) 3'-pyrophosphohydrolase [Candidatus Woesebacteria bacterium]|nr:MAG: bifunctional (p)ppGpp synthetase/guanosine-3',5'-bis(diphosphate) 3'-pyrophosphohydrolase [Candidatus Woesebacteria bacterium]
MTKNIEKDVQALIKKIKIYNPKADLKKIKKAFEFASVAHIDQKRLSGEPFIIHPLAVATILADLKLDTTSIIAGLLHDTIEDGGAKREDIVKFFGEDVALLVDGVTKVTSLRLKGSDKDVFVESLRKMILVMAKDLRVVFIKLVDRLHNMQTLEFLSEEKQLENAKETLEIYAPLAERLGISELKSKLEDLSFPYVYKKEFKKLKKDSEKYYESAEKHIALIEKILVRKLNSQNLEFKILARKKHLYSLFKKLKRVEIDWNFEKINDIVAFRILVNKISECYTVLGIVHSNFKPVPTIGISDFIAQPKPNGYQSIHTKVFGPKGRIVEIQIRTFKMHEEAENGIAAHWAYSELKTQNNKSLEIEKGISVQSDKLTWVKKLVEWQKEISDPQEFLKSVKFDGFQERNFIFSPKGDVFDLPKNATPVDFAYSVHTDLGRDLKSALVNGKLVPLNYKLKSGDLVEIIKNKNKKLPSRHWLEFVVTREAIRQINKELRKGES